MHAYMIMPLHQSYTWSTEPHQTQCTANKKVGGNKFQARFITAKHVAYNGGEQGSTITEK